MAKEHQRAEWKQSWRDEYFKWVCAFANTDGGVLEIGRDDNGEAVGVEDAEGLLETLPNRMRDLLGIIACMDLVEEDGADVIRITVEPYPHPVSYKGEYHVRSGSTKQVLKGAALDQFLLGKTGKRWDGVPVPGVTIPELDGRTLEEFRSRAADSGRIRRKQLDKSDEKLLDQLRLLEGDHLKRAAVLLFHPDPEAFINGAWVKLGFFASESDLLYQDEVHGNLFEQVDETIDLLTTKYLRRAITYEGIQRIERLPVPEAAIRETVLNAITHKDYGSGIPIQIKVFDDRVVFWNNGRLPEGWTLERLKERHPSQAFNPDVARVFFRAGMIEQWGRGIEAMIGACEEAGVPPPELRYEEIGLTVDYSAKAVGDPRQDLVPQVGTKSAPSRDQVEILRLAWEAQSLIGLMTVIGRSDRTKFRNQVLRPLLEDGLIEMTVPDKPRSPRQQYRTTERGRAVAGAGTPKPDR